MISRRSADNLLAVARRKRPKTEKIVLTVTPEFKGKADKAAQAHQVDLAAYAKMALSERLRRDGFET